MSQSLSRRSFLKCAGSGAVSLAAALLTGVSAAAMAPCYEGEPALLDGKAAVELLGYAPAPELGSTLVYLSVENLSAKALAVGTSYLQSRDMTTTDQLYRLGTGLTAVCDGKARPLRQLRRPSLRRKCSRRLGLYAESDRGPRGHAPLLLRDAGGLDHAGTDLPARFCFRPDHALRGTPGGGRSPAGRRPHHPRRGRQRGGLVTEKRKNTLVSYTHSPRGCFLVVRG